MEPYKKEESGDIEKAKLEEQLFKSYKKLINNEEGIILDLDQPNKAELQQQIEMIKTSIVFYEYALKVSIQQIKAMVDQKNQDAMAMHFICNGLLDRLKTLHDGFDKYKFEDIISSCKIISGYVKNLIDVCCQLSEKDKRFSVACKTMLGTGLKMYEREKLNNDSIGQIITKYKDRLCKLNSEDQKGRKIQVVLFASQQLINDLEKCKADLDKCQNQYNFEDLIGIYSKIAKNETDLEILLPGHNYIKDSEFIDDLCVDGFDNVYGKWKAKYGRSKDKKDIKLSKNDSPETNYHLKYKQKIMTVVNQSYKCVFEILGENIRSKTTINKSNEDKIKALGVLYDHVYIEFRQNKSTNNKSFSDIASSYKSIANQLEHLIAIFDNICCNNPTTLSKEQAFFLEKGVCLNKICGLYDKIYQFLGSYFVNTTPLEIDMLISMEEAWKQGLDTLFERVLKCIALMSDVNHYELGLGINNIDYVEIYKVLETMISILEKVKPEDLTKVKPDSLKLERLKLAKLIFSHLFQVNHSDLKNKIEKKLEEINNEINDYCKKNGLSSDKKPIDLDSLILRASRILEKNNTGEINDCNTNNKLLFDYNNFASNRYVLKIFFIPEKNKNKWIMFCVDAVLFLIILFALVTPYFIPELAFLHSIFALTLEIICGLLSIIYDVILIKSIYFENESNGKINIKGNTDTLNLQSEMENNPNIELGNNELDCHNK